mgnify:CR=1 FL=1
MGQEPLRIIDPHIHLWDQLGTPRKTSVVVKLFGWNQWLLRRVLKTAFPKDLVLFFGASMDVVSDYLPPEHAADASHLAHKVTDVVHVQAGWQGKGPMGPVGETAWLDGLERPPAAIVGHADMSLGSEVDAVLAAHQAASARFRGIRHMLASHTDKRIHSFAPDPELSRSRAFRQGFEELAARGLSFDAWCYHHQLPQVTELAKAFPQVPIVLCHLGTPVAYGGPFASAGATDADRQRTLETWRRDLAELAQCPNVVVKISGLAMPVLGWGYHLRPYAPTAQQVAEDFMPLVSHALEVFGPQRAMFASNFPVDRVSMPFHVLYGAYELLARELAPDHLPALFADNAARFYRFEPSVQEG